MTTIQGNFTGRLGTALSFPGNLALAAVPIVAPTGHGGKGVAGAGKRKVRWDARTLIEMDAQRSLLEEAQARRLLEQYRRDLARRLQDEAAEIARRQQQLANMAWTVVMAEL